MPREITISGRYAYFGRVSVHKYAQLNILSGGRLQFSLIGGHCPGEGSIYRCFAPGTKRIAYAHTRNRTWTTILHTEETDPDKIEELFTVETDQ